MTATSPCPVCGAHNLIGARLCAVCGGGLDDPAVARRHRALGAIALVLLVSAAGVLAIYEIHRTMPPLPPGFERITRPAPNLPSPESGDEARLQHLRRPEPGAGLVARAPIPGAGQRTETPANVAPPERLSQRAPGTQARVQPTTPASVAHPQQRLAALQQSQCGDQTLLARIVCDERIRLRYCRDRWNQHPDCTVSAPPITGF